MSVVSSTTLSCNKCGQTSTAPVTLSYEKLFLALMIAFWIAFSLLAGTILNSVSPSFHLATWAVGPGGPFHHAGNNAFGMNIFSHIPQYAITVAAGVTASALFVRFVLGVRAGTWAACENCGHARRLRPWHLRAGHR